MSPKANAHPEVSISEDDAHRYLHLDSPWVQGSMIRARPNDLHLEYIQRMMAGLLWLPEDNWAECHAVQLGLGASSLTKFCHKKLKCRTTAVELNPQVVVACRQWFRLGADDATLSVQLADAAVWVRTPGHRSSAQLLHVDLYDHDAAAPVLDSADFYADCRAVLTPGGVMAVNLFGRMASFEQSLANIAQAFAADTPTHPMRAFRPTREGNQVVLAQRASAAPAPDLSERAERIERELKLPAKKWGKLFRGQ